jgi:alkylation response protein AidB-like acyl-CoA dehydrogenase
MTSPDKKPRSAAVEALVAAGDSAQAEDIAALESASVGAQNKLRITRGSLVERMIYGPRPEVGELSSGAESMTSSRHTAADAILDTSLGLLAGGEAFTADKKLSGQLREAVSSDGAYGFTVPAEFGGLGLDYSQLACLEEDLAANGLGSLAVEISGQLTIGSSALLGYGTDEQRSTFLPLIADGTLIAFALTEVGVGVNAKRIQAWVDRDDESGCWRLHAEGARNKLYITSATHGGLAAIVARKGKDSREIGLFVVRLPDTDVDGDYGFECVSSNVSAFAENINSRLSFRNFPVPFEQEIKGDGVEVLFYCLRMGRCMLAAMCAGFQRMMASDAFHYAQKRDGVGGKIFKHELPRLGIGRILGGALTAQSLSHLALAQDAAGADLAGLRDLTKSASARYALESLVACERVIGGRSFDNDSRITAARPVIHAFGIVEGEDDLIRLGMVKDLTATFTGNYLQGLLSVLREANARADGSPLPDDQCIHKLGVTSLTQYPLRTLTALAKLIVNPGVWSLAGWIIKTGFRDIISLPTRLIPTRLLPRYRQMPGRLGEYLRFSERGLRRCAWNFLLLNMVYQLELTRAQIPMQRLGKQIELLMAMAAVCGHASRLDESTQHIAEVQAELIKGELGTLSGLLSIRSINSLRGSLDLLARDLEGGDCALFDSVAPEPHAHPWHEGAEYSGN